MMENVIYRKTKMPTGKSPKEPPALMFQGTLVHYNVNRCQKVGITTREWQTAGVLQGYGIQGRGKGAVLGNGQSDGVR
jgi:hypothetical protein